MVKPLTMFQVNTACWTHRDRDTGGQGLITNDDMGTAQAVSRRDLPDHR